MVRHHHCDPIAAADPQFLQTTGGARAPAPASPRVSPALIPNDSATLPPNLVAACRTYPAWRAAGWHQARPERRAVLRVHGNRASPWIYPAYRLLNNGRFFQGAFAGALLLQIEALSARSNSAADGMISRKFGAARKRLP